MPYYESRLNCVHDTAPPPSRRLEQTDTVTPSEPSENSRNSVPRNILDPIPSASRGNNSSASRGNIYRASRDNVSSASHKNNSSAPRPGNSVHSHSQRGSQRKNNENKMSAIATRGPLAVPPSPAPPKKCRIRRRRQAQRAANRNSGIIPATPLTQDERWANHSAAGHAGATPTQPEDIDPTSTMRTAVYPPSRIVGNSGANENSSFQIGLESSRIPGLYKPAVPDPQQDTQAGTLRVKNSGSGTSSPPEGWNCWNCIPADAPHSSPRHQRYRGCRPSWASRLPTPDPAPYSSRNWKLCPASDVSYTKETRSTQAFQKMLTQPLNRGIPASQTLTSTGALVWLDSHFL